MALAGNDQHITSRQFPGAGEYSLTPIVKLARLGACCQDFGSNPRRIFIPWIVVSDDPNISELVRDRAHHVALARVSVAPATENHNYPA